VEVAADGVQGDEGIEREVTGEVEAEFWVEENSWEDVEVGRVGACIDVSWRREDEAGAFTFAACGSGLLDAVWRGVEGWWDERARPVDRRGVGASAAGGRKGCVEREITYASIWDVGYWMRLWLTRTTQAPSRIVWTTEEWLAEMGTVLGWFGWVFAWWQIKIFSL
jgi:hypothetical protein